MDGPRTPGAVFGWLLSEGEQSPREVNAACKRYGSSNYQAKRSHDHLALHRRSVAQLDKQTRSGRN